jgi:hypothetical protein
MLKSLDFNEFIKKKREEDKEKPISSALKDVSSLLKNKEFRRKVIEVLKK